MATTPQPPFFFFIIFLSFFSLSLKTKPAISSSINTDQINKCSSSMYCSKNEPLIQFPFTLQNQPYCGYPGFTLSCNSTPKKTLVNLGSSGDYQVKNIDYVSQEIQINDPENCLPRRLLRNFSLSNTPFKGFYYRNYTFLNCSSAAVNAARFNTIRCLSDGNNYAVLATYSASLVRFMMGDCEVMGQVKVPISLSFYNQIEISSELSEDLRLSWGEPDCGDCVARGGRCGFVGNSTTGARSEIGCFDDDGKSAASLPRSIRYIITIGVGVPALVCAIGMTCYICAKVNAYSVRRSNSHIRTEAFSTVAPEPTIIMVGLDDPTIESYPKTVLGESRRLPKPDDNACPICLSEYRPKETLRTIPDCAHCFHANCIDEWLRINASCPLCRNSPTAQSPLADAL